MKYLLSIVIIVFGAAPTVAQEKDRYLSAGSGLAAIHDDSGFTSDIGLTLSLGWDITDWVGIEYQLDFGSHTSDFSYVEHIDPTIFSSIASYSVEYAYTTYNCFLGKVKAPISTDFDVVFKVGLATFENSAELEALTIYDQPRTIDVVESDGTISVVSIGIEFAPFKKNWNRPVAVDLKLYSGDQHEAVSLGVGFKIKF